MNFDTDIESAAGGRTDRHIRYLTVQTVDCTSTLVDRLVARPQHQCVVKQYVEPRTARTASNHLL